MNNTAPEPIVVIHDGLAYVFADEASLEAWSLHDSPTYQLIRPATSEELHISTHAAPPPSATSQ